MKRRLFLKSTMATTMGALVFPEIVPAQVRGAAAPSNKINIGLIGCGRIARSHNLPETLAYDSARVVAVCDVDRKRMAEGKKFIEDYYAKKTGRDQVVDVKMYDD